jgi:hypothetical protein
LNVNIAPKIEKAPAHGDAGAFYFYKTCRNTKFLELPLQGSAMSVDWILDESFSVESAEIIEW